MVTVADVARQLIDSVGGVRNAVSVHSRGDYLPDLSAPFDHLNLSGMSTFSYLNQPASTVNIVMMLQCCGLAGGQLTYH